MARTRQKVVIIIPTYNEKGNVDKLVIHLNEKIFPGLKDAYNMHVLVVDDSSPDGTAAEIRKMKKKFSNLHLIVNKEKLGLGNAYTKGMEHALQKLKAEVVFEFDADFSHDPLLIGPMLEEIRSGSDMVLGSRYMKGGSIPSNWGWHRKFLSVVGNLVIRFILWDWSIRDWTTGYRAIKSEVVDRVLPALNEENFMGYTFQIGFLHNVVRSGYKVAEVPLNFKDRELGKSKLGSEYIKNNLMFILRIRARELYESRVLRFLVVGTVGAAIQFVSFQLLWGPLQHMVAVVISIEMAIISNFILNNVWTFGDKRLETGRIPYKFVQFNITSLGSILIQMAVNFLGAWLIGLYDVFTLPLIGLTINTGQLFLALGVILGMSWNYFAYSRIIWQVKKNV